MKKIVLVVCLLVFVVSIGCTKKTEGPDIKSVEGIVVQVDFIATGNSFNAPDIKKTIVSFQDGKVMAFNGGYGKLFQKGKVNVVKFNHAGEIVKVEIK